MNPFTSTVIAAAKSHARREYPKESCGFVFRGEYMPQINVADDPMQDFRIASDSYVAFAALGGLEGVIHSHPDGPLFPTHSDMVGQLATALPWAIIATDGLQCGDPVMWGDSLPIMPIIGRDFMHGVLDCYSALRDTYRLGKMELAKQGVTDVWPYDPITLPEVPRDDSWWEQPDQDLYSAGIRDNGFRVIDRSEVRPGDGFLVKLRSDKFNHAGLLISNDLILHHLPGRLSRREPSGIWGRQAEMWVRYEA
jgi:proteasome lid subunit RPN8/RPN11